MEIRKHMIFSGEVQGVGFRYTAYMAARELGLTGWVANLSDGRVEMEVQGTQKEILHLVDKIKRGKWIEILSIEEVLSRVSWGSKFNEHQSLMCNPLITWEE